MRSHQLRYTIFVLTVLKALHSSAAFAQEQGEMKSDPKISSQNSTQQIEVKGEPNTYNPRRDDTVSKIVVTREEIEKYGDASVIEILNRQAGIVNGNIYGLKGYTQYLVDGQTPQAGFRISDIPVSQIERIEIVRSAVAEYSTQGIAGTINIVLQRTVKTKSRKLGLVFRQQDKAPLSRQFNLSFADKLESLSYDTGIFINLPRSLSTQSEQSVFRRMDTYATETVMRERSNSIDNSAYRLTQNFTWILGNDERFSINTQATRIEALNRSITRSSSSSSQQDLNQIESTIDRYIPRRANIKALWEKPLNENIKLETAFYFSRGLASSANRAEVSPSTKAIETHIDERIASNSLTWTGNLLIARSENDSSKIGWDIKHSTLDSVALEDSERITSSSFRSVKAALFAQREWEMAEQWSNYLGARWEGFHSSAGSGSSRTAVGSISALSPILQTRWKPHKESENQVRFAIARTFKAPDQNQLFPLKISNLGQDINVPELVANPTLRPEIAWGLDTAIEHFGENEVSYSLSHYFKAVSNLMRDRLYFEDNRWRQQTVNSGNAIAQGIVLDASFPIALVLKDASKFHFKTNFSRNWSRVSEVPGPNNRFADQAKFNANFDLEYKPNDAWILSAHYGIVSGGPLRVSLDRMNLEQVRRHTSLSAKWNIDKAHNLRISVSNLLKQTYVSETCVFTQTSTYNSRTKSPEYLSASAQFNMAF